MEVIACRLLCLRALALAPLGGESGRLSRLVGRRDEAPLITFVVPSSLSSRGLLLGPSAPSAKTRTAQLATMAVATATDLMMVTVKLLRWLGFFWSRLFLRMWLLTWLGLFWPRLFLEPVSWEGLA